MRSRSRSCPTGISGSACTSPTSRITCAMGARSSARPTSAGHRCTSPSGRSTCFLRSSRPDCEASIRTSVASYLESQAAPALYRIHEEPDVLKVGKFEEFVAELGYSLGAPLTTLRPRHFQKLLERIHGKPEEKPIAFLMLRTMQKARYAPE